MSVCLSVVQFSMSLFLFTYVYNFVLICVFCVFVDPAFGCYTSIKVCVCCEVSVGLVQGCDWHYGYLEQLLLARPFDTSFLSDASVRDHLRLKMRNTFGSYEQLEIKRAAHSSGPVPVYGFLIVSCF